MSTALKKDEKIALVWLNQDTYVGKVLDLNKTLTNGGSVQGVPISLRVHSDLFLAVDFNGKRKEEKYTQLIPWANVASLYME